MMTRGTRFATDVFGVTVSLGSGMSSSMQSGTHRPAGVL
jgi:hypothetical protein